MRLLRCLITCCKSFLLGYSLYVLTLLILIAIFMDHLYYPQGWVGATLLSSPQSTMNHLYYPQGWVGATLLSSPPSTMDHLYYPQDWVGATLLSSPPSTMNHLYYPQGWVGATLLSSPPSTMNHLYYPQGWVGATLLSSPLSTMDHLYYPQGWVCFTLYPLLRPSWITFITPRDRCVSPSILSSVHHGSLLLPPGLGVFHPLSSPPSIMDHFYYHQGWVCFTLYPFPPPSGITCTVRRGMDTSTVSPPPPPPHPVLHHRSRVLLPRLAAQ